MSGFERLLQDALEHMSPRWAREFEGVVRAEEVQAALDRLQKLGGDPRFAQCALTDCRWGRITALPAPRERNRLRRALRLLVDGQGEWPDRLRTLGGTEWKEAEPVLRRALTNLESFHPTEERVFKTTGTRYEYETPGLLSDRATTCLIVLDWHVRQATGRRRTNRILLGSLMDGFGLIKRARMGSSADAERWVEKRLERAAKKDERGHSAREFAEKFVVFPFVMSYHDLHQWGGLACGSACRPFEGVFRAAAQERLLYEADESVVWMRTGEPVAVTAHLRQTLEEAERLLGPRHAGLVPLLEGYVRALRATGERSAAVTTAKRIAGILVDARRRRQDLIGFRPGAGPNGDLLPVWREEAVSRVGETANNNVSQECSGESGRNELKDDDNTLR